MSKRWMLVLVLVLSSLLFAGSVAMAQEPRIDLRIMTKVGVTAIQGKEVDRWIGRLLYPEDDYISSDDIAVLNTGLTITCDVPGVTLSDARINPNCTIYVKIDVDDTAVPGNATMTIQIQETDGLSGKHYGAVTQSRSFSIATLNRVVTYMPPSKAPVIELSPGELLSLYHEEDIGTLRVNGGAPSSDDQMFIEIFWDCDALSDFYADVGLDGDMVALREVKAKRDAEIGIYDLVLSSRTWDDEDDGDYEYTHFDADPEKVAARIKIVEPSNELVWTPVPGISLPIDKVSENVRIGQLLVNGTDPIPDGDVAAIVESLVLYDQESEIFFDNLKIVDGQYVEVDVDVPDDAEVRLYSLEVYLRKKIQAEGVHKTYTKFFETMTISTRLGVTSVALNKGAASLAIGETETLTATVLPADAPDKGVTWSSSNESVATVVDGVVRAVGFGSTTITVKTNDGGLTVSCVITVSPPPSPPVTPAEPAETEDEKAVAAAVEAINQLNVSLKATSAPSPSGAMAALLKMLNEALAPSGVTITESDVKITDFTMPSADGDGGFTYTVELKIGDATGTITGSAVIPYTPSTPSETGVTATAESGSYDNEKPKAKHREIFAFADGKVQFDVGDAVVTKWKSSKPKVVKIDPVTGEATFLKRGTDVVITAILSDGTKLTKRINVVNMASELKLQWKKGDKWVDFSKESPRVVLGKKLTVRVTPVVPGPKAKMFDYDWTMGEPGVADKNAKETRSIVLTGKAEGQTTVTVTLFNGVTVTENVDVVLTKSPDSDAIEEIDETEVADVIDEMEEDLEIEE